MNSESSNKRSTNKPIQKTFVHRRVANTKDSIGANRRNFRQYDQRRVATAVSHGPVRREYVVERTSSGGEIYVLKPITVLQRPGNLSNHESLDVSMIPTRGHEQNAARRPDASIITYQQSMVKVAAIMDNATPRTLFASSEALLDALVEAVDENRTNFWRVADLIVQKAIEKPADSMMYANLCSEAYGLASQLSRRGDRNRGDRKSAFTYVFKRHLTSACDRLLKSAGLLKCVKPFGIEEIGGPAVQRRLRQDLEPCEQILRKRTTRTCRFLAHLFMARRFKLFNVVHKNIYTFLRACDEHSLECLCALLKPISYAHQKFETSKTEFDKYAQTIYKKLIEILLEGCSQMTLPSRTIDIINKLLMKQKKMHSKVQEVHEIDDLPRESNGGITEEMSVSIDRRPETSLRHNVTGTKNAKRSSPKQDKINQRMLKSAESVIYSVTPATTSAFAKMFLDILVAANNSKRFNIDWIMDYVVQTATERTAEDSMMYAKFCAQVRKKATGDFRESVRNLFPGSFKHKLIRSCRRILSTADLMGPEYGRTEDCGNIRTRRGVTTNDDRQQVVDADARARDLRVFRFMGHLFVVNAFKMLGVVVRSVVALMTKGDYHSLECLCALLTIVGPKIERAKGFWSSKIYRRLNDEAVSGYVYNTLRLRTVFTICDLLCLRKRHWKAAAC